MNDERKTKKELIQELDILKRRISRLEKLAAGADKKISGQELDEKSRYIFENIKDAMIYLDKKGFIIEVNKEAVRIFGGTKQELVGKHFTKVGIFASKDIPRLLSSFKTIFTGKHSNINLRIKNIKQEIFFIECSASLLKIGGKIAGMIAIVRDITERRRAEKVVKKAKEQAEEYLNIAKVMIAAVGTNEKITMINKKGCECLGYKERELIGKNWFDLLVPEKIREDVRGVFKKLMAGNIKLVEFYENPLLTIKGEERLFAFHNTILKDSEGKINGVLLSADDITEHKRAEEALKESRRQLYIRSRISELFLSHDDESIYSEILNFILEILNSDFGTFGYFKEDGAFVVPYMTREIFWDKCNVPDKEIIFEKGAFGGIWGKAIQKKKTLFDNEGPFKTPDGHIPINNTLVSPIIYQNKIISAIHLANKTTDYDENDVKQLEMITNYIAPVLNARLERDRQDRERKRAEEALRESYEIINKSPAVAFLWRNAEGWPVEYVSENVKKLFGYTAEDFMTGTVSYAKIIHPDDLERVGEEVARYSRDKEGTDFVHKPYRIITKGGQFRWIDDRTNIRRDEGGEITHYQGIVLDITERKRAEEALRESEERFRDLAEMLPEAVFETDRNLNLTFANKRAFELFGYSDEDLKRGLNGLEILAPEDRDRAKANITMRLKGENPGTAEYQALRKDGSAFPILFHASSIMKEGELIGLRGIIVNITERKRAEEALRESEERYRLLVENATEGILVAQDRFVKFANPRLEEITSYSREELLSRPFLKFVHPDDREFAIDSQLKRLKGEPIPETYEIRMITKYGDTRWLKIGGVIIAWEGKPASLNFVVDITETKRLKELESRAQRLEAAGQIAGQVAHDFNNLLAPLIAYPEFIRNELPHDHKALVYLDDIEKAAKKMADINQQLLTLGRRGHYNLVPLNLNDVIDETLNELKPFPDILVIETDLAGDLLNIKAGRAQIHRMLSNMINNARDATQDIGRIIVKTENYYADDISVAYGHVPKGEYIKLTISDTGHGISDEIIQKIFDPFFTTKTADKRRGSGLGLSVVDAVVKDHDGYLDLYSKVGEGTSFFFYFPITRENIDDQESERIIGGSESVLVVDDDDVQRKVSLKILTSLGYKATTVEGGEKAVEFLRENPHDLVILDMVMPGGIDGTETYRRILEFSPYQKAIILSGFSESDRVLEAQKLGAGAFIRKPLTRKKMAAGVRKELDNKEEIAIHQQATIIAVK